MAAKRKPGKYDHLLPKLRKMPPQDLEYQIRVELMKQAIRKCPTCEGTGAHVQSGENALVCVTCAGSGRRKLTGNSLAELYVIARADKDTMEQLTKDANLELEAVTQMLIASQESGSDSDWGAFGASDRAIKMTNGDALRVQPEVFAMPRNKGEFRAWCYDNGLRERMELPEKPTQDLVKARLLNGDSEPTGIEVYVRTRIVYTPLKTTEVASNDEFNDSETF